MTRHNDDGRWAQRFAALWERCRVGEASDVATIHAALCSRHEEPARRYHTLEHIRHCLRELDAAHLAEDIGDALELALWFHDAIYTPGAQDNERRSADLFRSQAERSLSSTLLDDVERMIMATTHRHPPRTRAEAWVVDIDLSSFGLPWPTFLRDSRHLREELGALDDEQYYAAHARFLRGLCARHRIFTTDLFNARYEHTARTNITRLLDVIAAGTRL